MLRFIALTNVDADFEFKVAERPMRMGMRKLRISKFLMYSRIRVVRHLRPAMCDPEFS